LSVVALVAAAASAAKALGAEAKLKPATASAVDTVVRS
jgi:hypothetical protein